MMIGGKDIMLMQRLERDIAEKWFMDNFTSIVELMKNMDSLMTRSGYTFKYESKGRHVLIEVTKGNIIVLRMREDSWCTDISFIGSMEDYRIIKNILIYYRDNQPEFIRYLHKGSGRYSKSVPIEAQIDKEEEVMRHLRWIHSKYSIIKNLTSPLASTSTRTYGTRNHAIFHHPKTGMMHVVAKDSNETVLIIKEESPRAVKIVPVKGASEVRRFVLDMLKVLSTESTQTEILRQMVLESNRKNADRVGTFRKLLRHSELVDRVEQSPILNKDNYPAVHDFMKQRLPLQLNINTEEKDVPEVQPAVSTEIEKVNDETRMSSTTKLSIIMFSIFYAISAIISVVALL